MGAQRTVGCPHCGAGRVTKASGRQALTCLSCRRPFLVRDAAPVVETPAPAADPVGAASGGGIGGVEVLAPAKLSIGALAFPEDPPEPPASEPLADPVPAASPPAASAEPPAETVPVPAPAPVHSGPGRKLGYYGKVTGL